MDAELLLEVYAELDKARSKWVIVEGKKDAAALRKLGFSKIVSLNGPLFKVVEGIEADEVVVLTDLDAEGRSLFSKLSKDLCTRGVRIDTRLREVLFKTELRQIEGLCSFVKNRQSEIDGCSKAWHVTDRLTVLDRAQNFAYLR